MANIRTLNKPDSVKFEIVTVDWVKENWGKKHTEAEIEKIKIEEEIFKAVFLLSENFSLVESKIQQTGYIKAALAGDTLYFVREYFNANEIKYKPVKVEGVLQDAVEGRLIRHLRKLGVKSEKLTTESGSKRFFVLFKWLCRDFPNRVKFVKTGFPSWSKKFEGQAIETYNKYFSKNKVKI